MIKCPICGFSTKFLVVKKDKFGAEYKYFLCGKCRFLFEQGLVVNKKELDEKVSKLYSSNYFENTDSGWKTRNDGFLKVLNNILRTYKIFSHKKRITVLDYGGGNGYIASKVPADFSVFYYDKYEKPIYKGNYKILERPIKADIIYAVELVEHLIGLNELGFLNELKPNIFIFTTCLHNMIKAKDLPDWEYLNPDAGHVSLHSYRSIYLLAKKYGFFYLFFPNITCHIFIRSKVLSKINFVAAEYFLYDILRKLKNIFKT